MKPKYAPFFGGLALLAGVCALALRRESHRSTDRRPAPDPRSQALRKTAARLGLGPEFEREAALTLEEIDRAWIERNSDLLAGVDDEEIQRRYEEAKSRARGRIERLLGSDPRHAAFRERLDEWLDELR